MVASCPSTNTAAVDPSSFISDGHVNFDTHRIGWAVAGATALAATIISFVNVWRHCRNYREPLEQRQIVRILLLPFVYGLISFLSYRYYRSYYYCASSAREVRLTGADIIVESIWEAIVIAAFLALLLVYVGKTPESQRAVLKGAGKRKLPMLPCIRYRPGKPYALHMLRFGVLQYAFIRPILSIVGIITEALGVYCPSEYSVHFSAVYIDAVDFVSISIALYSLIALYTLTRDQLKGRSPLFKFLCIKLIVFATFYQGFIFSLLAKHGVLKPTQYWTSENIANGLQALCTCCEMVLFASAMLWSFSAKRYIEQGAGQPHTSFFRSFLHAMNLSDMAIELWLALRFVWDYARGKPGTHSSDEKRGQFDVEHAFNQAYREEDSMPMVEKEGHPQQPNGSYSQQPNGSYAQHDTHQPPNGAAYDSNAASLTYPTRSDQYSAR